MKELIVFDLDGTIAESKSSLMMKCRHFCATFLASSK
jgi:phosphoglycolate phosphatase-like HAD superfamily hydrolase